LEFSPLPEDAGRSEDDAVVLFGAAVTDVLANPVLGRRAAPAIPARDELSGTGRSRTLDFGSQFGIWQPVGI
jgi:hypothetical protein